MSLFHNSSLFPDYKREQKLLIKNNWISKVQKHNLHQVILDTKTFKIKLRHIDCDSWRSAIQYLVQIQNVIEKTAINQHIFYPRPPGSDVLKIPGFTQERESLLTELQHFLEKRQLYTEAL